MEFIIKYIIIIGIKNPIITSNVELNIIVILVKSIVFFYALYAISRNEDKVSEIDIIYPK